MPIEKTFMPNNSMVHKAIKCYHSVYTHTHAQENCDKRINKVNLVTVPKENANLRCPIQVLKCRTSLIPFDFMIIRSHTCLTEVLELIKLTPGAQDNLQKLIRDFSQCSYLLVTSFKNMWGCRILWHSKSQYFTEEVKE